MLFDDPKVRGFLFFLPFQAVFDEGFVVFAIDDFNLSLVFSSRLGQGFRTRRENLSDERRVALDVAIAPILRAAGDTGIRVITELASVVDLGNAVMAIRTASHCLD